jgi:ribonuclease HI
MKKKHIKALQSLKKWLIESQVDSIETQNALAHLEKVVSELPDKEEKKVQQELPVPKEISGERGAIALFTDGGCRGNPGPGAFAFVIQKHDGQILCEGVEFESLTTNNRMELSGALRGLDEACEILPQAGLDPLLTKVKVMTDSKYVVDGMKSWVAGWKARGWRKADNKAPENLELWQSLDLVKNNFMQVEWVWVKGHAGHPQNEYCDRKANEVMDKHS